LVKNAKDAYNAPGFAVGFAGGYLPLALDVNIVQKWNDIDISLGPSQTSIMPRTRLDELYALAKEHDGLLLSKEARALGIKDSVLVRLAQRGRLERMTRGVYRIAQYPTGRLA
jgi:hypothetical protein